MRTFTDTIKPQDTVSIIRHPLLPHRIQATVLEVNHDNGTIKISYNLNGQIKTRTVEFDNVCLSLQHFADNMRECLQQLVNVS